MQDACEFENEPDLEKYVSQVVSVKGISASSDAEALIQGPLLWIVLLIPH